MAARIVRTAWLPLLLASLLAASGARAEAQKAAPPPVRIGKREPAAKKSKESADTPAGWQAKHGRYFQRNWGVDVVGVRPVSSGYMLRFTYRAVDPSKARVLTNRKSKPYLIDEKTGTALSVPAMENIGELRQVAPPEQGRSYFMIFGNPGKLVKAGDHVTLVVGNLRIEGLVVG